MARTAQAPSLPVAARASRGESTAKKNQAPMLGSLGAWREHGLQQDPGLCVRTGRVPRRLNATGSPRAVLSGGEPWERSELLVGRRLLRWPHATGPPRRQRRIIVELSRAAPWAPSSQQRRRGFRRRGRAGASHRRSRSSPGRDRSGPFVQEHGAAVAQPDGGCFDELAVASDFDAGPRCPESRRYPRCCSVSAPAARRDAPRLNSTTASICTYEFALGGGLRGRSRRR